MLAPLIVDRSFEATAGRLPAEAGRARAWHGRDLDPDRCLVSLDERDVAEVHDLAQSLAANPLPLLLRRAEHFELPRLGKRMAQARQLLDDAHGVAVVDALPTQLDWPP